MIQAILKNILPKYQKEKLAKLKKDYINSYAIKSYSQEGEDMIL